MTPEQQEAKRKARVMMSFAEGKAIRFKMCNASCDWRLNSDPAWDWCLYDYEVIPEPKELWAVYTASGTLVSTFTSEVPAGKYAETYGSKHYIIIHMREVTDE